MNLLPWADSQDEAWIFKYADPKHVLHLVWSAFVKYTANRTALKVALYDFLDGPPAPLNSQLMEKVNYYNLTKKINFSMGPSVKFVLAILDSISKKVYQIIKEA